MKTLALNMIVGAGESFELNRCLDSACAPGIFDEIIIVQTAQDDEVLEVAKKFTDKIIQSKWLCERYPYGNFSRARNVAIENTTADYIMWLDADDIVVYKDKQILYRLKETLFKNNIDYYFMLYDVNGGKNTVMRERIFRRNKNVRWFRAVHEELSLFSMKEYGTISGINIKHLNTKLAINSINRNLKIIDNEISSGNDDPALLAYNTIEKFNSGIGTYADIEILKSVFNSRPFPANQLASIAARIAIELWRLFKVNGYYDDIAQIDTYSRIAIDLCSEFAEPYITLAEIYMLYDEKDKALILFKEALSKTIRAGAVQQSEYYKEIPLKRIADIYCAKKEYELALYYVKKLLAIVVKPEYTDMRNQLLVNVSEELYVCSCKN